MWIMLHLRHHREAQGEQLGQALISACASCMSKGFEADVTSMYWSGHSAYCCSMPLSSFGLLQDMRSKEAVSKQG